MMRRTVRGYLPAFFAGAACALGGCSRGETNALQEAGAAGNLGPSASIGTNAATPAPSAPPRRESHFEGSYTTVAGTAYVPDSGEYPKWRGEDSGVGLGDGTLSFSIDPATHVLSGKGDGALGEVRVNGLLVDDKVVSFAITRAVADDRGLVGYGYGTLAGDSIEGTLHASNATASMIREGSFKASRK